MDAAHWDAAYGRLGTHGVSWYRADERASLDLLARVPQVPRSAIDVGGGAAGLAATLLRAGIADVAVLDISGHALAAARTEHGGPSGPVDWIEADVRDWRPERTWDLWHDRAVFHFMADEADRAGYRRALAAALGRGGHVIAAAFAPDGPDRCSGLPVCRYGPHDLVAALGADLVMIAAAREVHVTPSGSEQPFTWVLARRRGDGRPPPRPRGTAAVPIRRS